MPAVITIESGADSGRSFQIEEEVVRIGRAPGSQIMLSDPDAPPTAVAVRFQGGRYMVYNRTAEMITIGGMPVGKDQARPWLTGQAVAWSGTILRLSITGDPAPARRAVGVASSELGTDKPAIPETPAATTAATTKAKPGGAKTGQIVVIVLTWIVIIGVLAYTLLAPDDTEAVADQARYTKLVADLDAAAKPGADPLIATTVERLKEARMADRRGHKAAAKKAYGDLVVQLQNRPATKPETKDPLLDRAQEYARNRIKSLSEED